MLHYATVQGMQSKFLWKNFFQPISSWNGPGHRGDVRRGWERAAGLGVQAQGHKCPHCRQMPTPGGIRSTICLEPDQELGRTSAFPGVHLKPFLCRPRKCGCATS